MSTPIPLEGLPPVDSQQNQPWRDFTLRAMRGGVQGYFAFLRGQRVTYFGPEWFPGAKR